MNITTPIIITFALSTAAALCQGPLAPSGAPAPTMKSLQQIWDKIGTLETTVAGQQQLIQQQSSLISYLADAQGYQFPWAITTVDSPGMTGEATSMAMTPDGQPAIAYRDGTTGALKYAVRTGAVWNIGTAAALCSGRPSLAFAPTGHASIAYHDPVSRKLHLTTKNASGWLTSLVDNTLDVGFYPSLAYSPSGAPAISYGGSAGAEKGLKYAIFSGGSWQINPLTSVTTCAYSSLGFSPSGHTGVSFRTSDGKLGYTESSNGISWGGGTMAQDAAGSNSFGFNPVGQRVICFHTSKGLEIIITDDGSLEQTVVDPHPNSGAHCSLAFGPSGQPAISYFDGAGKDLTYATYDGLTWRISKVDLKGDTGRDTSLVFLPNGQPAISYFDITNGDLKFAERKAPTP
jgi:hypothetical protein